MMESPTTESKMLRPINKFWEILNLCSSFFDQPPSELWRERSPRSFRLTFEKGSVVSATIPDVAGRRLALIIQRPIEASDVKDGKLKLPVWSKVKRRGGKRQTGLVLSLESAEALHVVLGKALEEARIRRRQEQVRELFALYIASKSTSVVHTTHRG